MPLSQVTPFSKTINGLEALRFNQRLPEMVGFKPGLGGHGCIGAYDKSRPPGMNFHFPIMTMLLIVPVRPVSKVCW